MFQFYNFTARHTDKGLQQTSNHTANLIEHQAIEVLLGIRYYYHYYSFLIYDSEQIDMEIQYFSRKTDSDIYV